MLVSLGLGQLFPLLTIVTYRRAGRSWRAAVVAAAIAVGLTLAAGVVAVLPIYVITVNSGLCGHFPVVGYLVGALGYAALASFALLRPGRLWAWPLALWLAIALQLLVASFYESAHAFCET